ncbi:MAG TPA: gluconate 2-dehydrogenase subunit 3 family protein [Vicinamibacteria bacterium]|nr:gluconate 2-dehydrogenase subunit 3 family protein [Vicinamibacteria bacterium]
MGSRGWKPTPATGTRTGSWPSKALRQEELIGALAYKARWREGEEDGRAFFALLRDYTVMGYYTSKVGMEALGAPGLRQHYPGPPGCPHPADPAHCRLSRS